jgi:hypothetical protein
VNVPDWLMLDMTALLLKGAAELGIAGRRDNLAQSAQVVRKNEQ